MERRKAKRVPLQLMVSFAFGGRAEKSTTLDVSVRGFFVITSTPLAAGTITSFSLDHPEIAGPLKVIGRVAHIVESGNTGMGVEIKQILMGQDEAFDRYRKLIGKSA